MSRTRRSAYTFLSGSVWQAVLMITGLVATPLLLRWIGQERYGTYLYALQWTSYLALLELGRGTAILPLMIRSKDHPVQLHKTMQVAFQAWRSIAVANVIGCLALAWLVPLYTPGDLALKQDLRLGLLVSALAAVFVPLAPVRLLLESCQRGYIATAALMLQSLVVTGFGLAVAWLLHHNGWSWQVTGQLTAGILGVAAFQGVILWQFHRLFPGLLGGLFSPQSDPDIRRQLNRGSWATFTIHLTSQVGWFTDSIVVGSFLGPSLVVPFNMTQKLAVIGQGQLRNISAAVWAPLGELYARGEHERFKHRMLQLGRLIMVLGFAGMVPLVAYNRFFVTLWVGHEQFGGELLTVLACFNAFVFALLGLWELAFNATGHLAVRVPVAIASSSVNIVVSVVATLFLPDGIRLAGPVMGTTAAYLLVHSWWHPWLLRRLFRIRFSELCIAIARPCFVGIPYTVLAWVWTHQGHLPWGWASLGGNLNGVAHLPRVAQLCGWLGLGAEMGVVAAGYLILAWPLALSREDRQFWQAKIQRRSRKNG